MTKNISRSTVQDICRLLGYDPKDVAQIDIGPHMINVTTLHHTWTNDGHDLKPKLITKSTIHMVRDE